MWQTCRKRVRQVMPLLGLGSLLVVRGLEAAGFGIPSLDGFMTNFGQGVTGAGIYVGGVGLVGYVGSLMDNPFSTILSGSINYFTKAGILGGGTTMLGSLGLTGGATF